MLSTLANIHTHTKHLHKTHSFYLAHTINLAFVFFAIWMIQWWEFARNFSAHFLLTQPMMMFFFSWFISLAHAPIRRRQKSLCVELHKIIESKRNQNGSLLQNVLNVLFFRCFRVNRWTTELQFCFCSNVCQLNQSHGKNVLFPSQRVEMHRICFEPSHVNEMKRNDRTNVKSIRYITRSYTNWNENISQQDTQRGTKTKSSIQADSDSQLCCVWLEMNESLSLSFSVSPFCVHFRCVYRCEESLPMELRSLSRSLCVGNILCA